MSRELHRQFEKKVKSQQQRNRNVLRIQVRIRWKGHWELFKFPIRLGHGPPPSLCRPVRSLFVSACSGSKQRPVLLSYLIQCLELSKSASKDKNLLVNWRVAPILPQFGGGRSIELGSMVVSIKGGITH